MLRKSHEEQLRPIVAMFVRCQNGFYLKYCSDKFLTEIIMHQLGLPCFGSGKSFAEMIISGDGNAAYDAVCWLFEIVLEHGCSAGGNGHHVAQQFAEMMDIKKD